MKIAIFTNNYLPNPYGVSGSVESFRRAFQELGHEVYVFAPKWKGYEDKNPPACLTQYSSVKNFGRVFRYPAFKTNIKIEFPLPVPYSKKISAILDNLDLDIIHSQHPNLLGSAAARWAKKKNIPLVFTWHTLYDQYAHFVPFVPRRLAAWWAIRNARNYANQCDAVITPTKSIIDIIKKWGVTNENITAIPTGVEEEQLVDPNGKGVRKKYGVKDEEILLVLMTRLTAEKNVEFLLEAVLETLKKNNQVKFMVCGEGNLKKGLVAKVERSELSDRVIFVGIVPNDEKKDFYAAGDIFVWASKSETQGMILTEAMYVGLPIVAVRATGAQDIVENGRTGFLVSESKPEFTDAVQKLIASDEMRKKFGDEARRVAKEKYTSSVSAKKMLEVYEKAISAKLKMQSAKPQSKTQN